MTNHFSPIRTAPELPPTWTNEVALFRAFLTASNLSQRYIDDCVRVIRLLAVEVGKPPAEVTFADLIARQNRGIGPGSMSTERSMYRRFFSILFEEEMIERNPANRLPRVKKAPARPRPLSVAQIELMLNGVEGGRPAYRRTRAMIMLGALQGWRVAEMARASGEMFDLDENTVTYVAKGPKERVQPLHPSIRELATQMPRRGFWFPSYSAPGGHILPRSVSALISRRLRTVGISDPRLTAHSLRHFYGTQLLRGGADIRVVAEVMGHESTATTMRYTEVDLSQQALAITALPPLTGNPDTAALAEAAGLITLDDFRRATPTASGHGSRSAYRTGCRCEPCRRVHAEAVRSWRERRSEREPA